MDAGKLIYECNSCEEIDWLINVPLNVETEEYAQELIRILSTLSRSVRSILDKIEADEEIDLRRRVRQLLVLLKGNDILVYVETYFRDLPRSGMPGSQSSALPFENRTLVALAPAGEYGETTIRVSVNYGRPYVLVDIPGKF